MVWLYYNWTNVEEGWMTELYAPDRATGNDFGRRVTRAPRLSDQVAEAMLEEILGRNLRPGDILPSERELAERYEVSRTVVREAVRSLGARGVVQARVGRGLTVARVEPSAVSASMRLYLHGTGDIPYRKIHQVRMSIEVQIAGYAAEQADDDEISELRRISAQLRVPPDDIDQPAVADVEFHRQLALMTHNELFLIMLDSISDVMLEIRRAMFERADAVRVACREHDRVARAVAARDAGAARDAMRRHLEKADRDWAAMSAAARVAAPAS